MSAKAIAKFEIRTRVADGVARISVIETLPFPDDQAQPIAVLFCSAGVHPDTIKERAEMFRVEMSEAARKFMMSHRDSGVWSLSVPSAAAGSERSA